VLGVSSKTARPGCEVLRSPTARESTGTRVKFSVLCAPGAVMGFCGSGKPHMPQKRIPDGFSNAHALQTTDPPGVELIVI
jgi:hypothetical protein